MTSTPAAAESHIAEAIEETVRSDVSHCLGQNYDETLLAECLDAATENCLARHGDTLPNPRPCTVQISTANIDLMTEHLAPFPRRRASFETILEAGRTVCSIAAEQSDLPSLAADYCWSDMILRAYDIVQMADTRVISAE